MTPYRQGITTQLLSIFFVIHVVRAQLSAADRKAAAQIVANGLNAQHPTTISARQREINRKIAIPGAADLSEVLNDNRLPIVANASPVGGLSGLVALAPPVVAQPVPSLGPQSQILPGQGAQQILQLQGFGAGGFGATTVRPPATTTFAGFLAGMPYPFVLPPPDIPYFGSKWNGPWGYPIGHYQAFRGTGQYITHYDYYPLSYFGSLMAPFAYGLSGKK